MTVRMALFKKCLLGRIACNDFIFIDRVHQDHQGADGRIEFVPLRNISVTFLMAAFRSRSQVFVFLVETRRGNIIRDWSEPLFSQIPDAVQGISGAVHGAVTPFQLVFPAARRKEYTGAMNPRRSVR